MAKKKEKHYRKGFWARMKKIHYDNLYVDLSTLTRHIITDNEGAEVGFEYAMHTRECRNGELPRNAVHRTGADSECVDVQMEPRFPVFDLYDEDGNQLPDHNDFSAQGYNAYARDDRMDKAERALDYKGKARQMDLQKIITIVLVGIVVAVVVAWFVLK